MATELRLSLGPEPQPDDWKTVSGPSEPDDWQTISGPEAQPEEDLLSKWEKSWVNKPLLEQVTYGGQQIYDPAAAAEYYDPIAGRTEEQAQIPEWVPYVGGGTYRSLGAGLLQGAGEAIGGLTTPLNVATMGAFKGAGTLTRGAQELAEAGNLTSAAQRIRQARGLTNVGRGLSAPVAATGGIQTARGIQEGDYGKAAFGAAQLAGGAAGVKAPRPGVAMTPEVLEALPVRETAAPVQEMPPVQRAAPIAPEMEFIDPNTGEIRLSSQAKPGDIPLTPSPEAAQFAKSAEGIPPPPMADLSKFSPQGLAELNKFMETPGEPVDIVKALAGPPAEIPTRPTRRASAKFGVAEEALGPVGRFLKEEEGAFGTPQAKIDLSQAKAAFAEHSKIKPTPLFPQDPAANLADTVRLLKRIKDEGFRGLNANDKNAYDKLVDSVQKLVGNAYSVDSLRRLPMAGGTPTLVWLNKSQLDPNVPIAGRKAAPPTLEQTLPGQIWNVPRSLQSIDLPGVTSAALRQSRPLAFSRDWFKAWNSAAKAFGSEDALTAINDKIKNSKYFQPRYRPVMNKAGQIAKYIEGPSIAEELGVKMTDVIHHREEAIASGLAEKVPIYGRYVKASNRAYTGFLNDLRAAKFEQLMDGAKAVGRNPEVDQVLGQKLADFVNNATGRGSLKFLGGKYTINAEPIADYLGMALYSPRALSARLSFMNPYNYSTLQDPLVRQEYWKSLARIGISWGAFSGLASLLPKAHVSMDPSNPDFGKVRIGNTRLDPGAGFQQLLVVAGKEAYGGSTSSTGPPGKPGKFTPFGSSALAQTRLGPPSRYIYNQLNPSLRFVVDMLLATQKEPFDLTDRTLQLVLPMYAADIAEAAKSDNAVAEFFAPLLSSMGMGAQTYTGKDFNKPKITPFIKQTTGVKLPTVQIGAK